MQNNTANSTGKKITIIPAKMSLHPERDGVDPIRAKKRVAAYCRVSTSLEEQQGSYELQKKYYDEFIRRNPDWEPAGVYGDEGKSGTSLKGRIGFLEMMDDVRAGKIDYIVTKATSRFGRNNAEFIQILDELESYGVEVLFESEGIVTSGQQNRAMLQVMGMTNENYSNTLSNNIRWSKERNMRKGKVSFCYKNFLGYEKGDDGEPKIVEEEAKIIRLIYNLFLEGKPYSYIAKYLSEQGIPSPGGKASWQGGTVKSILTNEKYAGDALLQKTFKESFLDRCSHVNNGEKPQVLVENNHPAIIDKATFAKVQKLIKSRSYCRNSGTSDNPFSGKIICGDCGECFGHKTWTSRGRIKYTMWVCNHKYSEETTYGGTKCKTANLRQEWIEQGYLYTMNQVLARRSDFLAKYERKLARVNHKLESGEIEKELKELTGRSHEIEEERVRIKAEMEFVFGEHTSYDEKLEALKRESQSIMAETRELEAKRDELNATKKTLETIINAVKDLPESLTKFHAKDFTYTIDHVTVGQYVLAYHLYGDECIKVNIELLKKMCY